MRVYQGSARERTAPKAPMKDRIRSNVVKSSCAIAASNNPANNYLLVIVIIVLEAVQSNKVSRTNGMECHTNVRTSANCGKVNS
jgi:hypothetical protein